MKFGIIYVDSSKLPNVQFGAQVWKRYACYHPRLANDLYAEMLMAVFIANHRLAERTASGQEHTNPEAYIRAVVKGFIRRFISSQPLFKCSETTLLKGGARTRERSYVNLGTIPDVSSQHTVDIKEIIESCYSKDEFWSKRERRIVQLLIEDYTQTEIANTLCQEGFTITQQRVQQIIANFKEKVKCKLENGGKSLMKFRNKSQQKELH